MLEETNKKINKIAITYKTQKQKPKFMKKTRDTKE